MWNTLDVITGEEEVQDNFQSSGPLTTGPLEEELVRDTAWDLGRERTTDRVGFVKGDFHRKEKRVAM